MTTDPFEEFEFKPLTEGLGFHRQTEKKPLTAATETSRASLPEIQMPISSRVTTPEKTQLPRQPESSTTVDEILKTLQTKRKMDFTDTKRAQVQAPAYRTSAPDFSSLILDAMLVTAGTLACLIVLLMVTKVDLFNTLTQAEDEGVYLALGALVLGVCWIYLSLNRIFVGFTPGEWVFDQRIGLPQEQGSAVYAWKVLARSTLIVLTGLFAIPLLSILLGRDLAGQWTGTALLKKV